MGADVVLDDVVQHLRAGPGVDDLERGDPEVAVPRHGEIDERACDGERPRQQVFAHAEERAGRLPRGEQRGEDDERAGKRGANKGGSGSSAGRRSI